MTLKWMDVTIHELSQNIERTWMKYNCINIHRWISRKYRMKYFSCINKDKINVRSIHLVKQIEISIFIDNWKTGRQLLEILDKIDVIFNWVNCSWLFIIEVLMSESSYNHSCIHLVTDDSVTMLLMSWMNILIHFCNSLFFIVYSLNILPDDY